jgi:hypothetical protein
VLGRCGFGEKSTGKKFMKTLKKSALIAMLLAACFTTQAITNTCFRHSFGDTAIKLTICNRSKTGYTLRSFFT